MAALGIAASGCGEPALADGGVDAPPPPHYCDPDLRYLEAPFASIGPAGDEVHEPVPFERPEGNTLETTWLTPRDRASRHQYWLIDDDPFQITFRWMLGTAHEREAVVRAYFFVDGIAQEVGASGGAELVVPLVDGLAEHTVSIPVERFPPGLGVLHVYKRIDDGRVIPGGFFDGAYPPFAVFRETTELQTVFEDTPGYTEEAGDGRFRTQAWNPELGTSFIFAAYPPPDGTYRIVLHAQADPSQLSHCPPGLTDTFAIVALLDGAPTDLGAFGRRIIATLALGERRVFELQLDDLPVDGAPHRLEILQLSGLGHPMQDALGRRTVWSVPMLLPVARAVWQ